MHVSVIMLLYFSRCYCSLFLLPAPHKSKTVTVLDFSKQINAKAFGIFFKKKPLKYTTLIEIKPNLSSNR